MHMPHDTPLLSILKGSPITRCFAKPSVDTITLQEGIISYHIIPLSLFFPTKTPASLKLQPPSSKTSNLYFLLRTSSHTHQTDKMAFKDLIQKLKSLGKKKAAPAEPAAATDAPAAETAAPTEPAAEPAKETVAA